MISIHALLAESDSWPRAIAPLCLYFYPRSPCGERRYRCVLGCVGYYFYPRSPCGERPVYTSLSGGRNTFLSTLSLRRATMVSLLICNANFDFYPRSPCGERHGDGQDHRSHLRFLSTLSLRRATFYTASTSATSLISIHALLAESDVRTLRTQTVHHGFLSTLSLRRATRRSVKLFRQNYISIHALLAESD